VKSNWNAKTAKWGLYRNTIFQMGEILRKEERFIQALHTYLEVFYIDLHGPTNNGGVAGFPAFDREFEMMAPGIINRIVRLIDKTGISDTEVGEALDEIAKRHCQFISKKIPASTAHDRLKAAFVERDNVIAELKRKK
jgi:hypothetical protein